MAEGKKLEKWPDEHDIRNHGIIGDTYSVALVTVNGTIDWCAFPRMDSPPVFSSLLDVDKKYEFRIALRDAEKFNQSYAPNTNILRTRQESSTCCVVIEDFMPVEEVSNLPYSRHEIHRVIRCIRGHGTVLLYMKPGFNFGRSRTSVFPDRFGCVSSAEGDTMSLSASFRLEIRGSEVFAEIPLRKGDAVPVVLRWNESRTQLPRMEYTGGMLRSTAKYWRKWVAKTRYRGLWKESVIRSALVLKLLTYSPTGAICAAATTSLPESIGNERNWDYRFSWIRDSTYALLSFNALGHTEEEKAYFLWLIHLLRGNASVPDRLRVMYTVEGDQVPEEKTVNGMEGYRGSVPVRDGNSATGQLQLDIYGSVVEAIYATFRPPAMLPDLMWRIVDSIADYLCDNWQKKDMGIWEMRNGIERHTHSAVLTWVALTRASEMAGWLGFRGRMKKYAEKAEIVRADILQNSFNRRLGSFASSVGGGYMDASVLLMPSLGFIDATDSRFISTLDAVKEHLVSNGFVYRYKGKDGLSGREGAFIICTFWYIESLARAGRIEEAKGLFEHALAEANHLGLYSEEINPEDGEFLGNFPQAFSHMGLIGAAMQISGALHSSRTPGRRRARE